jgi:hypothetical protein
VDALLSLPYTDVSLSKRGTGIMVRPIAGSGQMPARFALRARAAPGRKI